LKKRDCKRTGCVPGERRSKKRMGPAGRMVWAVNQGAEKNAGRNRERGKEGEWGREDKSGNMRQKFQRTVKD